MSDTPSLALLLRTDRPAVLALTGAVRQATAYDFAAALGAEGRHVVVTATVPVSLPSSTAIPALAHTTDEAAWERLPELLGQHGRVALLGAVERPDRVAGLGGAELECLRALPQLDVVVVIADGSRHRPLKAPAAHEPALPPGATVVLPMAGLDALGQAVDERSAHRPEHVLALLHAGPHHRLTAEDLAAILLSPAGGRKGVPDGARVWPVLYGATPETEREAERVTQRLLESRLAAGVVVHRKAGRDVGAYCLRSGDTNGS